MSLQQTQISRAGRRRRGGERRRASASRGAGRRHRCASASPPAARAAVDPNQTTQGSDNWATEQMYEQLVRPDDGDFARHAGGLRADAGRRAGQRRTTRKTWIFKLRQGVQFHKGYGEMTSDDVVFVHPSARRRTSPTRPLCQHRRRRRRTGHYEVDITLQEPRRRCSSARPSSATTPAIVSKKAEEEMGEKLHDRRRRHRPLRARPLRHREAASYLSRHEDYWGEKAKIANVECLYIADTTARTLALLSGDVDMIEARARAGLGALRSCSAIRP